MFTLPLLKGRSGRHTGRGARTRSRIRPRARRLRHEPLEERQLLSVSFSPGFDDPSGLNLLGRAAVTNVPAVSANDILRLTPAIPGGQPGWVWFTEKQFVSVDFETTFQFSMSEGSDGGDGTDGSDGLAFVIQNTSVDATGGGAGGIGYHNMPNSLAVEFDTWLNNGTGDPWNDPSKSHVSVHTRGTEPNSGDEAYSLGSFDTLGEAGFLLDDAQVHTATISYVPGMLTVSLDDLGPIISAPVDIAETLDLDVGRAWVGFVGSTGGGWQNHDILNWQFTSLADTTPVIAIGDVEQLEGDAGQTIFDLPVTATRPDVTGPLFIQVDYATGDGTATSSAGDYVPTSGTLTFNLADGQAEETQIVQVTVNGDEEIEDSETFFVSLSNPNPVEALIAVGQGQGTIVTDDITISIDDVTVVEGGQKGMFLDVFVPGTSAGLAGPTGAVVGPDGKIYVSNYGGDNVVRLDPATGQLIDVFVSAGSGGLHVPCDLLFGPDGNLYVSSEFTDEVFRYSGATGELIDVFVTAGSGGVWAPKGIVFGPHDGNLYVASRVSNEVLRYDGNTGEFIDVFVARGSGGLNDAQFLVFGPDGNLYVNSVQTDEVFRFNGWTGEFIDVFVTAGSGGLDIPIRLSFGPDGHLYVSSEATDEVLRYDGTTGDFIDAYVPAGRDGLDGTHGVTFAPDGTVYVISLRTNELLHYNFTTLDLINRLPSSPPPGTLDRPAGLTFGPDENMYVASFFTDEILRYDASGNPLPAPGKSGATFVEAGSGGLDGPSLTGLHFGPDGNLYVAGRDSDNVLQYDGATGALIAEFVPAGSGGLDAPKGMVFGPDGNLYVSSSYTDEILRYDGSTGDLLGTFVTAASGGLANPRGLAFGPNGRLYVASSPTDEILRYDQTGAFIDAFVAAGSGGLDGPDGLLFGPNGHLYVTSRATDEVLRYDGTTGAFLDVYASAGSGGLDSPLDAALGPDGNLYVSSRYEVLRYGPSSQAVFAVSLSNPSAKTVTVDFGTVDGTATAGGDYTAVIGTVVFEPGMTQRTIIVPTLDNAILEDDETFLVNLSNATGGATIADGHGIATVVDDNDDITLGDVNGDGQVNGLDVDPFVDILLDSSYDAVADMNEDGAVNGLDVDQFVAAVVGGDGRPGVALTAASILPMVERLGNRAPELHRHVREGDDHRPLSDHRAVEQVFGGRLRLEDRHRVPADEVIQNMHQQHAVTGYWQATVDRAFGDRTNWIE